MKTPETTVNKVDLLAALAVQQKAIEERSQASLKGMLDALKSWGRIEARGRFDVCLGWNELLETVSSFAKSLTEEVPLTYVADAWFLQDLIRHLTPGPDEEIAHVTGVRIGNVRVLSRICEMKLQKQSPVYAKANARSCADTEISILEHGNVLHVMAHSHPGGGAGATFPSSIDVNYLGKIQRVGSDAVGIIVTRDGWVRFFTVNKPFRAIVLGDGATQVEDYVYHITLPDADRHAKAGIFKRLAFRGN